MSSAWRSYVLACTTVLVAVGVFSSASAQDVVTEADESCVVVSELGTLSVTLQGDLVTVLVEPAEEPSRSRESLEVYVSTTDFMVDIATGDFGAVRTRQSGLGSYRVWFATDSSHVLRVNLSEEGAEDPRFAFDVALTDSLGTDEPASCSFIGELTDTPRRGVVGTPDREMTMEEFVDVLDEFPEDLRLQLLEAAGMEVAP